MEFLNAYSESDDNEDDYEDRDTSTKATPDKEADDRHGELAAPSLALPSALTAFEEVEGPPSFLDPEARRQFSTFHPSSSSAKAHGNDGESQEGLKHSGGKQKKQAPGPDFDISKLAPPLKGSKRDNGGSSIIDIRGQVNPDAVISGQAKRYKLGDEAQGPQVSLAQIALLGGNIDKSKSGSGVGGASRALPVDEFLVGKGGNAQTPRKGQDRRDKEKEKRIKGQSAIGSWKSEAEMVLAAV